VGCFRCHQLAQAAAPTAEDEDELADAAAPEGVVTTYADGP